MRLEGWLRVMTAPAAVLRDAREGRAPQDGAGYIANLAQKQYSEEIMAKTHVTMKVNGAEVEGLVEPRTLLVHFIRENLLLTGAHIGCEQPIPAPAPSISTACR